SWVKKFENGRIVFEVWLFLFCGEINLTRFQTLTQIFVGILQVLTSQATYLIGMPICPIFIAFIAATRVSKSC
ncbi:hypothetical protein, partial [Thalassotalea sp. ND16A]|uniref:hypothetical protein n=1 Tax=Thalassotalea sp. ND16A TaxID=1535422 RepID=UPI00051A2EDB